MLPVHLSKVENESRTCAVVERPRSSIIRQVVHRIQSPQKKARKQIAGNTERSKDKCTSLPTDTSRAPLDHGRLDDRSLRDQVLAGEELVVDGFFGRQAFFDVHVETSAKQIREIV
jgi:hypothetical protein